MKDLTELSSVDELLCQRDCWDPAVVVVNRVRHFCFFNRVNHRLCFGDGSGQRLFAQHHFAGFGGGDRNVGVHVVGRANVNRVDVVASNQGFPVGFGGFVSPLVSEGGESFLVASTNGFEDGLVLEIWKEVADPLEGVGVGASHKAITD